jgi:hypothetical protein
MYCLKLVNLDPARLDKIKWLLDEGIVNHNVWLAGGSLRTLIDPKDKVVDYDLFFKYRHKLTQADERATIEETKAKLIKLGFKLIFECPEGKLFSYSKKEEIVRSLRKGEIIKKEWKVQLVCEHFYQVPEELLSTFDLTPSLFCTDGTYLWTYKSAVKGVKRKTCDLHKLTYPVATFKRIIKYANKGYNVNPVINSFVSNLNESQRILDDESMRVYID